MRLECLQNWPHFENIKEATQVFMRYAEEIIYSSNLATVAEPYTVLQKKLVPHEYDCGGRS